MDQLDEIKSKIDIVQLISEYLPLKKAGRNYKVLCPFHSEKTPSFIVSPERQIFKCFGCGVGGDVFKFLMLYEKMTFPEAVRTLAKRAGVKLKGFRWEGKTWKEKEKIFKVNYLALEFFHWLLLNSKIGKKALDYALGRGIKRKSIELFKLGYAPSSWDALQKFFQKRNYSLEDLHKAGLVVKSEEGRFYDRFRGRLMFPLFDHRGNVRGFAGRLLDPEAKEAKYINTPETLVYKKGDLLYGLNLTKDEIRKKNLAVVVEGEIDLISSWQAGVANVVAIKGTALTESQVRLLKRFTERIALALDADIAGDAAVRRGIEIADRGGLSIKVVQLPEGKDPDECAQKNPLGWQKAVQKAVPIFDFLIDSALSRFDKNTAEGKKKICQEVLPVFSKIADEVVKAHYLQTLGKKIGVEEEVLWLEMRKLTRGREEKVSEDFEEREKRGGREGLERYLLSLILQGLNLTEKLPKIKESDFLTPSLQEIFKRLKDFLEKEKFSIGPFVKTLPSELVGIVDECYLWDLGPISQNLNLLEKEIQKTVKRLREDLWRRKLRLLGEEIRKREEKGEETAELQKKFDQLARRLKSE